MKIGTWWSDTCGGSDATFTTFRCIVVVPSAMLMENNFTGKEDKSELHRALSVSVSVHEWRL
jgi:hypothetical protein